MIHHIAGEPGSWTKDQLCWRCCCVLRLRGSRDMYPFGKLVGEVRDKGRNVFVPGPITSGVRCYREMTEAVRKIALSNFPGRTFREYEATMPSGCLPDLEFHDRHDGEEGEERWGS